MLSYTFTLLVTLQSAVAVSSFQIQSCSLSLSFHQKCLRISHSSCPRVQLTPPQIHRHFFTDLHLSTTTVGKGAADDTASDGPPALVARDITCSFDGGQTYQLQSASYILPRGARVGLVGRNGCGKSTFLKILAESCAFNDASEKGNNKIRDNIPFTGEVECSRDVHVAFVEQEPPSPTDVTVSDALLGVTDSSADSGSYRGVSVYEAVRRYRVASLHAATNPDAFSSAALAMDATNGWGVLTKADEISSRLHVKHLEDQSLSSLSGGERKRVALAAALVREPDVLILDEPTNHLDLAAIGWLSDFIKEKRKMTLLTVTHDRAFLEEVCNSILELDRGSFYSYKGSYTTYLKGKEERLANEDQAVKDASKKYRRELEWMRRQPQARETKQKARIEAFHKLEKSTKPRIRDPTLEISEGQQRRLGRNILKLRNISLGFGNRIILSDFSYDFNKGDRIGIVGRNGVGKSTFIRVLIGDQPVDAGLIEAGETVVFGLYDQMGIPFLDEDQFVLDFVKERVESTNGVSMAEAPQEAMKLLRQFQFPRNRWQERVSMLSGGERRRLQLLSVLTKKPNFLILDEPTNDIDLDTLRALESYLEDFKGVLIIVSHDRLFTDKVTNHLFVFEGDGIVKDYLGSLSDYAECLIETEKLIKEPSGDSSVSNVMKASFKEERGKRLESKNRIKKVKQEMNNAELAIEKLRVKASRIQDKIDNSADEGWTVLAELTEEMQKANDEIGEIEMKWLELAEELFELEGE